jgi:indolepyruvate ferredoxin oxidoreductase beta subunit
MLDRPEHPRAIRLAIMALGGEGGGVLADWVIALAEANGFVAQLTSVPGVAQRTGATIYYVELFPRGGAGANRGQPVLALMPFPGDVDIVVASELMEAARAVQRGFVTPDRTTLIASTNRVFAMTEKIAMADGREAPGDMLEACRKAAKRLVAGDMAAIAEANGSVISAALFGALAGAETLPFPRQAFEETIRRGGVGVAASLKAFGASYEAAKGGAVAAPAVAAPGPKAAAGSVLARLLAEVEAELPPAAQAFARSGVERLVDYQDAAYARLYLDRLKPVLAADRAHGDGSFRLTAETARFLALGMAYEDTIRVAELKIRASRFARVRQEVGAQEGQIVQIAEFLHPRLQEIAESVPARLGRFLLKPGPTRRLVERLTAKGRVV